jgi:hypothetical protein
MVKLNRKSLKFWLRDLDLNQGPSGYEPDGVQRQDIGK